MAAFIRDATTRKQGKHDRPLSGKHINLLLNVCHAIYDKALGEELVQANPVVGVQRPKVTTTALARAGAGGGSPRAEGVR